MLPTMAQRVSRSPPALTASHSAASHVYIARLDHAGNRVRVLQPDSARFNGVAAHIAGNALGTDASGNFYIAGNTEGDYDGNTRRGDEDGFVSKPPGP